MKRLLIDVNSIVHGLVTGEISGIGRTTLELVKTLEEIDNLPFEITLYSQNLKGMGASNFSSKFNKIHFYLPDRDFFNKVFSYFPIKQWASKHDLLHIPHNFQFVQHPEKTIFTLHDAFFMKIDDPNFDYKKMRREVPNIMRSARGIITCSNHSKKDIIETMDVDPDKIEVIYWGYNDLVFKKNPKKNWDFIKNKFGIDQHFFLSYSCNSGRKNTDKLIKSYLKFAEHEPNINLVLIWSNPPKNILSLLEDSPFRNRIHFLNSVDDFNLAVLLQHAEALIYPSAYEGFGLPVLEALASGCLVLTGNNSSLTEVGGEAAIYFEDLTVNGIYKEMQKFISGFPDKEIIIEKGYEHVKKFSWKNSVLNYIEAYKKFLYV